MQNLEFAIRTYTKTVVLTDATTQLETLQLHKNYQFEWQSIDVKVHSAGVTNAEATPLVYVTALDLDTPFLLNTPATAFPLNVNAVVKEDSKIDLRVQGITGLSYPLTVTITLIGKHVKP